MRRFPITPVLVLLALALVPAATAQAGGDGSVVDVVDVRHPDTVLVDRAFPVEVDLVSHASEGKEVYLFGALYDAASACGDGFRAFTHQLQAVVPLPPGARVTYPAEDDPTWWHVVSRDAAGAGGALRFCVFAAESEDGANARLTYFDRHAGDVTVRLENAKPVADFTFTPTDPSALQDVTFTADASDADGDALTYAWDFGRHTADGRATATGAEATHAFYPDGTFTVTLRVSDAWDTTEVQKVVRVGPEPAVDDESGRFAWLPVPGVATPVLALALACALALSPRRPS